MVKVAQAPVTDSDAVRAAWKILRASSTATAMVDIVMPIKNTADFDLSHVVAAVDRWVGLGAVKRLSGEKEAFVVSDAYRSFVRPPDRCKIQRAHRNGCARMWTAIRVLKVFSIKELTAAASVSEASARKYMRLLERAGYVAKTTRRSANNIGWRLIRHTGPHHPGAINTGTRTVALVDRNTGERHDFAAASAPSPFF